MRPSQIQAVDHVVLETSTRDRERLLWFYRDVLELAWDRRRSAADRLCFTSGQLGLTLMMRRGVEPVTVRRRAVISVRSLDAVTAIIREQGMEYFTHSGLTWTDRRISLIEPGGNRIELKQEWRAGVFSDRSAGGPQQATTRTGRWTKKSGYPGDNGEPIGYSG